MGSYCMTTSWEIYSSAIKKVEKALEEARLVTKVEEPYTANFGGLVDCIYDLLDIIDQKDGDIQCIEDEFNDYKEFVEDNYRHKSAKEMGWE